MPSQLCNLSECYSDFFCARSYNKVSWVFSRSEITSAVKRNLKTEKQKNAISRKFYYVTRQFYLFATLPGALQGDAFLNNYLIAVDSFVPSWSNCLSHCKRYLGRWMFVLNYCYCRTSGIRATEYYIMFYHPYLLIVLINVETICDQSEKNRARKNAIKCLKRNKMLRGFIESRYCFVESKVKCKTVVKRDVRPCTSPLSDNFSYV